MGSQQGDDLQLNGDMACENAEIRGELRVAGAVVTPGGGPWTRTGTVISPTVPTDRVAIGTSTPTGSAPLTLQQAVQEFIQFGSSDAFARRQIWFTEPSSVLRLGADAADGDAFSADSEGVVIYFPSADQLARIKADRFGLTRATDSSLYYWRVDETSMFYRADPPGGTIWFHIDRATGTTTIEAAAITDATVTGIAEIATAEITDATIATAEITDAEITTAVIAALTASSPVIVDPVAGVSRLFLDQATSSGFAYDTINNFLQIDSQGGVGEMLLNAAKIGFFGSNGTTRQTITGSRGGNAALASLLTALANYQLITNNTTA